MGQLVECVPNFSEGRNAEVIDALVACVRGVPGVYLLDREMDRDHHRAVVTFVGEPEAVGAAALSVTREAARLINLEHHQGGHPRVGATDVVPFVPVRGMTMEDCVALAKRVGARIGREVDIPVFLYERAASRPERVNLEDIRRGGLDDLARRMQTDPAWSPDFGPARLHPTAGATVVGARPPLIAYNVNLKSQDLSVAKEIAKTVRASGGGLPYVKAIGVRLASRELVQVSMNLTNFEETPVHAAFQAVQREAERRGLEVVGSEVIGLVPERALLQAAESSLQLEGFDPTQVLETRLQMVLTSAPAPRSDARLDWVSGLGGFLEAVAAGTPTPGGGSVAALAGAMAAALGVMACRVGGPPRPRPGNLQAALAHGTDQETGPGDPASLEMERRLLELGERLRHLVLADAEAYDAVLRAYRLSKNDASRPGALSTSLRTAIDVPLETSTLSADVGALLSALLDRTKPILASDLRVGLFMAAAGIEGGLENARANLNTLKNQEVASELSKKISDLQQRLVQLRGL
jgi:glutamate formiminotransferase/glutamate formiminotransferase/formiminotetrahydrofolate cyclodeaminase